MDGSQVQQAPQVDVDEAIRLIKSRMPETYKSIQAKAAQSGREAYAMVRRSIAGQANTFWAVERGMVVGTPFNMPDITVDVGGGAHAHAVEAILKALAAHQGEGARA